MASSEIGDRPVTWDGSPHLEPGLDPKDILLFEDFEDDHYRQKWKVHWNEPVGAGTVNRPSMYVFSGKWYCLELMLKNNIPRQKNGQLWAWLDGKLMGHGEKICFQNTEKVKIQRFAVYSYFGGSDYEDTSPKNQRIYLDNLVISRMPIGCFISNP